MTRIGNMSFAEQERRLNINYPKLDEIVESMWPDFDVPRIAKVASILTSRATTPKEIYSSHLRTVREQTAIDMNQGVGGKE